MAIDLEKAMRDCAAKMNEYNVDTLPSSDKVNEYSDATLVPFCSARDMVDDLLSSHSDTKHAFDQWAGMIEEAFANSEKLIRSSEQLTARAKALRHYLVIIQPQLKMEREQLKLTSNEKQNA